MISWKSSYAFLPLSLVGYTFLPMRTVFSTGRRFYDIIFYEQIEAGLRRKSIGFLLLQDISTVVSQLRVQ